MMISSFVLLAITQSTEATAEQLQIYQVSPLFDVLVGGGAGVVGWLLDRQKLEWYGVSPCESIARIPTEEELVAFELMDPKEGVCDASTIAPVDRWVIDQGFEQAHLLSNLLLVPLIMAPMVTGFLSAESKVERLGEAFLVSLETHGLIYLMTAAVKTTLLRARPLTYSADFDKEDRYDGDARLSFFSGHSAHAFAAASTLTIMLSKQGRSGSAMAIGVSGLYVGAALVAYFRIAARKHFLTDVVVGALVGTVVGLVVPLLHGLPEADPTTGALSSAGPDPEYHPLVGLGGAF
jgi:membrane-associated phospholipid phosphatase